MSKILTAGDTQTETQTQTHTHTHTLTNTMTPPGLEPGPIRNYRNTVVLTTGIQKYKLQKYQRPNTINVNCNKRNYRNTEILVKQDVTNNSKINNILFLNHG